MSHTGAHTADVNKSDKQKSGFLDPLRKSRVAHADGQGAMPFLLEMGTNSWYGFARAEEALGEFFHPTDGLGPADTDDGGGTADENSIPLRGEGCLTNGSSSCPKEAAGPSHLPRVERGLEVGWTDKP